MGPAGSSELGAAEHRQLRGRPRPRLRGRRARRGRHRQRPPAHGHGGHRALQEAAADGESIPASASPALGKDAATEMRMLQRVGAVLFHPYPARAVVAVGFFHLTCDCYLQELHASPGCTRDALWCLVYS